MTNKNTGTRCWAFVVWVCVDASQTIPLFVLVRNPHKGPVHEISHETGRERGKEGPREERRRQSAEEREEDSRQGRAVKRSQKVAARTC